MAHAGYEQLTLGLFDTASPYSLSLGGSAPAARAAGRSPSPCPRCRRQPFRSPGGSPASAPWPRAGATGRATTLAAIRLLQRIEAEDRPATAAEQAVLGRFTGFGAGELAGNLFRRPGEGFRHGWEEIGQELERWSRRRNSRPSRAPRSTRTTRPSR